MTEEYSEEQMQKFRKLHQTLVDAEKDVEKYKTEPAFQPEVFRKRFAMLVFGEYIPNYEREVPQDVRDEFGFDVKGLATKVKDLMGW